MIFASFAAVIDFLLNYAVFSYQRATLLLARNQKPDGTVKEHAEIQTEYTPTWIGFVGWLTWVTLLIAIFFLWQQQWWYAVVYVVVRFLATALLPTFEHQNSRRIYQKYQK